MQRCPIARRLLALQAVQGTMRTASAKAADEFKSPRLSQRAFTTDRDLEIRFTNRIRRRNETELFQVAKRGGGADGKDAGPHGLSDLVVDIRKSATAKLIYGTQNEPVEWFERFYARRRH